MLLAARWRDQTRADLDREVTALRGEFRPARPRTVRPTPESAPAPRAATLNLDGEYSDWMRRGAGFFDEKRYDEAAACFEAASRECQRPAPVYYLALCLLHMNQTVRATRLLGALSRDFSNSPYAVRADYWLAREYLAQERVASARKLFFRVLAREDLLGPEDRGVLAGAARQAQLRRTLGRARPTGSSRRPLP